MRLGINMPFTDDNGVPLDAAAVGSRAKMVEDAGFDGIWLQDSMDPGQWRPDGLQWLLACGVTTTTLELGFAIYLLPIHNPVDMAQRALTLQALTDNRFTLGVGAASRPQPHASMGTDYEKRFSKLYHDVDVVRRLSRGETVGAANLSPWDSVKGGPRIALGAWFNEKSLARAANEYEGWICSAGRTSFNVITEGLKRYRDLGGTRAIVATIFTDLEEEGTPFDPDGPFNLKCPPEEAARRLQLLADAGFDDALIMFSNRAKGVPRKETDYSMDELVQLRSMVDLDPRRPWDARETVNA
ncbi:MAG: Coenzyme F420-dependent N10-methylene tetrahydromethanopterin reductase-like protein [Microbacteriaceae bacterium]|jgi:alkanesulfonate monooxygenase SsuD/methylene tetrahydromethanopterin reductase-like flavin-dependent oxidoreductase (luciferase family)|nr:Coenzyme F420-dependent N10-methylene tetrahydromethanopterin reductase-like protein [Microbacteriaceae bacterium]